MPRIRYTPEAAGDLKGIQEYVSGELDSPDASKKLVTRIRKHIRSLERFPNVGERLDGFVSVKTDYRRLVSGNYLVFYRVENDAVSIIRILHGSRNYNRILFGELVSEDGIAEE